MHTRHLWLDLARGGAVVSMLVAHTAPAGGIFNVTEYLTAPLFVALIGASQHYAYERWTSGAGRFVGAQMARGAILFLVGVLLQPVYLQIVVVLQWLGVLMALLAPVVVLRPRWPWLIGAALLIVAASPPFMRAARAATPSPLLDFLIAGEIYRLIPFMAAGLLGIALARRMRALARSDLLVAAAAGGVAAVAVVVGKLTPLGADPYAGTWPELVAGLALVVAVSAGAARLASPPRTGWLAPLAATGQMAMTAYVLQSVILRGLEETVLRGQRDDHWWVLALLIVAIVGFCWAWRRRLGQGPLERLLRLPMALFK